MVYCVKLRLRELIYLRSFKNFDIKKIKIDKKYFLRKLFPFSALAINEKLQHSENEKSL
jgi:hypothetical protein